MEPWQNARGMPTVETLAGDHPLRYLVEFSDWPSHLDAVRFAQDTGERFFRLRSPIEQYLVRSRRTLFKEMVFSDLKRLQIDIETTGLTLTTRIVRSSSSPSDRRCSGGDLHAPDDEAELLERVTERLRELDPDAIEGHNLFNFDLPFMVSRAERFGVALRWGRDGSPIRIGTGTSRFKGRRAHCAVYPGLHSWSPCHRHYQQIQRYDIGGFLSSYALKAGGRGVGADASRIGEFVPDRRFRRSGGTIVTASCATPSTMCGTSRCFPVSPRRPSFIKRSSTEVISGRCHWRSRRKAE
jgi:hypothetical protein